MKHLTIAAAALLATAALGGAAHAQSVFTERDTTYDLDTSGGLSNTVTSYNNTITLPSGGGSATNYALALKTGAYGVNFNTVGDVTQTYAVPPPGTASETGDVVNGGNGGLFFFGYTTNNGPDFTSSWTEDETLGGHNVLHFAGGGTNFLDIGGTFYDTIYISGDWSGAGLSTGDHTGLTYDPSFTVLENFIYDSALNSTILRIATSNFQGGSPNISFYLVGDALPGGGVPEPAQWSLMLAGFGVLGAAVRRRATAASS